MGRSKRALAVLSMAALPFLGVACSDEGDDGGAPAATGGASAEGEAALEVVAFVDAADPLCAEFRQASQTVGIAGLEDVPDRAGDLSALYAQQAAAMQAVDAPEDRTETWQEMVSLAESRAGEVDNVATAVQEGRDDDAIQLIQDAIRQDVTMRDLAAQLGLAQCAAVPTALG